MRTKAKFTQFWSACKILFHLILYPVCSVFFSREREDQLEKIRSYLADQLTAAGKEEEERIRQAVSEHDAADALKDQEKAKRLAQMLAEIEAHRVAQIQQKRKEMEAEKLAELEEVRVRAAAERAVAEYEAQCAQAKLKRCKQLSAEYLAEQVRLNFGSVRE